MIMIWSSCALPWREVYAPGECPSKLSRPVLCLFCRGLGKGGMEGGMEGGDTLLLLTPPLSTVAWLTVGWLQKCKWKIIIKKRHSSTILAIPPLTRSLHDLQKGVFCIVTNRQTYKQTDRQMDITTLWLNRSRGRFIENILAWQLQYPSPPIR